MIARRMLVVAGTALLAACSGPTVAPVQGPMAQGLRPKGEVETGLGVIRVVDGDTIHVNLRGEDVTVRMIGINTPETVKPASPVECFGPESSQYANDALAGRRVTLEFDASQGRTDRYGRTLAYVWVEGTHGGLDMFNLNAVTGGYAEELQYGATVFAWKSQFLDAENAARSNGAGLWGACDSGS